MVWIKEFSQENENKQDWIANIIILTLFLLFLDIVDGFIGTFQLYIIENRLFRKMLEKIMWASIPLFFERTPSGKILNRFISDLERAKSLPNFIKWYFSNAWEIITIFSFFIYYSKTHNMSHLNFISLLNLRKSWFWK